MCNFASFIVERSGTVHWCAGTDNHHEILSCAGIDDSRSEFAYRDWAKVEVIPPDLDRTRPVSEWSFQIDEVTTPDWFEADHHRATLTALAQKLKAETGVYCMEITESSKKWLLNGKLHHEDGLPAIEHANGDKEWWLNGERQDRTQ